MVGGNLLIAMKDVDLFVPETELEVSRYAILGPGSGGLDLDRRVAHPAALDVFRSAYSGRWIGGTAFLTSAELVFIPAVAHRAGHPLELAIRVPLSGILGIAVARSLWRDALTLGTAKGRMALRGFMARRFAARVDLARAARLGRASVANGLHPQSV